MTFRRGVFKNNRAQSMAEVAIFGAAVIFLVGAIVKNVVTTSFAQQYALRTMRESLTEADKLKDTMKLRYGGKSKIKVKVQSPHNRVVIEDRLFPGVFKYGAGDRTPYISAAFAVLSKDLFDDPSFDEVDTPKIFIKINGQKPKKYAFGGWTIYSDTKCNVVKRQEPGEKALAWKEESEELKEIIEKQGRATCMMTDSGKTSRFPVTVAQDMDVYKMLDPTQKTTEGMNVINPFDSTQGIQQDLSMTTTTKGTLEVENAKESTDSRRQTDRITRFIKTNAGVEKLDSILRIQNRTHKW